MFDEFRSHRLNGRWEVESIALEHTRCMSCGKYGPTVPWLERMHGLVRTCLSCTPEEHLPRWAL